MQPRVELNVPRSQTVSAGQIVRAYVEEDRYEANRIEQFATQMAGEIIERDVDYYHLHCIHR